MEPWWNPGATLVEPSWNPRGTLSQGRSGPPRSLSGLRPQSFHCWGKKEQQRRPHVLRGPPKKGQPPHFEKEQRPRLVADFCWQLGSATLDKPPNLCLRPWPDLIALDSDQKGDPLEKKWQNDAVWLPTSSHSRSTAPAPGSRSRHPSRTGWGSGSACGLQVTQIAKYTNPCNICIPHFPPHNVGDPFGMLEPPGFFIPWRVPPEAKKVQSPRPRTPRQVQWVTTPSVIPRRPLPVANG